MKHSVLLVDDFEANLYTLELLIKSKFPDVKVFSALSANEALIILLETNIDLAILDVQMPEINGFEMASLMKQKKSTQNIPIVFLTALYKDTKYQQFGFELGAIEYLTKPIEETQFLNKLALYFKLFEREKELLKKQKQIQTLLDIQSNILFVTDAHEIYQCNQSFLDYFSYKDFDCVKKFNINDFLVQEDGYIKSDFKNWLSIYIDNKNINKSTKVKLKSKDCVNTFLVEIKVYPYIANGLLVMLTDITQDAKELDDTKLKQKNQEALLFQQSKMATVGEAIGAITHQWNQPLNNLSLLATNLQFQIVDKLENEDIKVAEDMFEQMQEQIQFLSQTVLDFKKFSTPSKLKDTFDIKKAILDIIKIIHNRFLTNGIEVNLKIEDDIFLFGYKNDFKHVVMNILNNSIEAIVDYRKKNGLYEYDYAGIINIESRQEERKIILYISDNGGGIDINFLPKLFKQFETTKGEKGTGIGLYITKTIIEELFFGSIEASNIENGAKFTITLERRQEEWI